MKASHLISLSSLALAIGFAPNLAPVYVSLFNPSDLDVVKQNFVGRSDCTAPTSVTSACTDSYLIDLEANRKKPSFKSLGVGQVISASRIICRDNGKILKEYDDVKNPGKIFDLFNQYQTVELEDFCSKIEIQAWNRPAAIRKGKIDLFFTTGTTLAIERVKRLSEFFNKEIYQIFCFCFLFLYIVSSALRVALPSLKFDSIDRTLVWWILAALVNTGVFQLIVPNTSVPAVSNRIGGVLIFCAFALPGVFQIMRKFEYEKVRHAQIATSAVFILSCSAMALQTFSKNYVNGAILISFLTICISLYTRSFELLILAVFEALSVSKSFGLSLLPHAQTVYLFVGLISFYKMIIRLKVTVNISNYVSFISKLNIRNESAMRELAQKTARSIHAGRITFLRILSDSSIKLVIYKDGHELEKTVDSIPPIFAHVLSLRSEIWHINVHSIQFKRIKKVHNAIDDSSEYVGDHVILLPIYDEERLYGAVAVTDYDPRCITEEEFRLEQKNILSLLCESIRSGIQFEIAQTKNNWTDVVSQLTGDISNRAKEYRINETDLDFQSVTESIATGLTASCYIAELDQKTRQLNIKGIFGFDPFVQERFIRGRLFANLENEQGPIALAANKKKVIIVPDVALIKGVLHENTVLFFEKNETKSCAAIPLYRENSSEVWGLIWLERRRSVTPFSLLSQGPLESLSNAISHLINLHQTQQLLESTSAALHDFIPDHIYENYVNKNQVREEDVGYILMIDLKGSTKISLEKGSDFWIKAVQKLIPKIDSAARNNSLTLREYKWDSFIFTLSSRLQKPDLVDTLVKFYGQAAVEIENWYASEFSVLSEQSKEEELKARCCVSFGDITRDFSEGATKVWTIVGSEMAAVHKLEDTCKKLSGTFFTDQSINTALSKFSFIETNTIVSGTERKVLRLSKEWKSLVSEFRIKD